MGLKGTFGLSQRCHRRDSLQIDFKRAHGSVPLIVLGRTLENPTPRNGSIPVVDPATSDSTPRYMRHGRSRLRAEQQVPLSQTVPPDVRSRPKPSPAPLAPQTAYEMGLIGSWIAGSAHHIRQLSPTCVSAIHPAVPISDKFLEGAGYSSNRT